MPDAYTDAAIMDVDQSLSSSTYRPILLFSACAAVPSLSSLVVRRPSVDPRYSFDLSREHYDNPRSTWHSDERNWVNPAEWSRDHFNAVKQQRICSEAGLFDIGTDYDKIRRIRAEKNEACERLKT